MKFSRSVILIPALVSSLSGCVIAVGSDRFESDDDWAGRAKANNRSILSMDVGRSMESIVNEMGNPDITEAFQREEKAVRIYYYRTQRLRSDYRTTKDEATPLVFIDGVLVGWGETAIENAKK